jgi:phospholipase/carboxylesterase
MWAFERTLPEQVSVVSLQAFLPDAAGGFSWWDIASDDPKEPRILQASDRLDFAIEKFIDWHDLTPSKVIALGFSQGSVVLSSSLLRGSLPLAGLGILAGSVFKGRGAPRPTPSSRVFLAHGIEDEVVTIDTARSGVTYLQGLGIPVTYVEEAVGHKLGVQGMRALKEWLAGLCG